MCDNCGAVGKLGFVVGQPDGSHKHACQKPACAAALEVMLVAKATRTQATAVATRRSKTVEASSRNVE